jgi:hypothetical protein
MEHPVGIVDCHAHIIDLARFPFGGMKGYQPRAEETGTREAFCADRRYVLSDNPRRLFGFAPS